MNIQTIISLITILCFGQSHQRSVPRNHSHHMQRRSEQQDTAAEDSLAALEREVTRERREAELTGSSEEAVVGRWLHDTQSHAHHYCPAPAPAPDNLVSTSCRPTYLDSGSQVCVQ